MQCTDLYYKPVIEAICHEMGLKSTYGGCGPIAMIGIADFFARYLGYTEIINNPDDLEQQKNLIREFLNQDIISTSEIKVNTSQGPKKQTLALPWNCEKGFNTVMKNHNLGNTIKATDMGFFLVSKKAKIDKIKEQVDKGLPVTLYAGLAGDGNLGNHYVNVYGYSDWTGKDQNGKTIIHTMLQFRMNWGNGYTVTLHMDSDILSSLFTGIIYYDITYKYQILPDMLFMGFKNERNQGQYFNEVVEKPVSISEYEVNMSFMTRRLRCSYLDQGYLVLSANRDNHDTAYLEFEFEEDIRQVGLNLSLWSQSYKEKFQTDASLRLEYFDKSTNKWEKAKDIDVFILPLKNEVPKNILTILPKATTKIRIIVENKGITTDRNKGRIVIHSVDAYFDTYNQVYKPHEHTYNERFVYKDESTHWSYCVCGLGRGEPHIVLEGSTECLACGRDEPSHEHTWDMENYDEDCHKVYCECGEYVLEEHSYTYETIDGNTHRYYCVCGDSHIESHIIDTTNNIHGTFHCNKCDETLEIAHNFTSNYESNGENGHTAYCECGESITEEHTFITQNGKTICQYCNYEQPHIHQYVYEDYNEIRHQKSCECGESMMEEHIIDCFDCHYEDEDYHTLHCICGHTIYEEHDYSYMYIITDEYHKILCGCFDYVLIPHDYSDKYEVSNDEYHKAYCSCQRYILVPHYYEEGSNICMYCGYQQEHIHQYTYEKFDDGRHIGDCSCGDTIFEAHDAGEIRTGHGVTQCIYCGTEMLILHIFQDHYEQYDENEHKAYCICGDEILESHIYNENGVCIYCNHEDI